MQYHHDFMELQKLINGKENYLVRAKVSAFGTVPYGTSRYFIEITQTTLNKNKHRVISSYAFVQETKTYQNKNISKQSASLI